MNNFKNNFKILYVESLVSYSLIVMLSLPGMILDFGFYTILLVLLSLCWTLPIIVFVKILFEFVPRFYILKSIQRKNDFNYKRYYLLAVIVSVLWTLGALIINEFTIRQLILPLFIGSLNTLSIYIAVKLNYKYKFIEFCQGRL